MPVSSLHLSKKSFMFYFERKPIPELLPPICLVISLSNEAKWKSTTMNQEEQSVSEGLFLPASVGLFATSSCCWGLVTTMEVKGVTKLYRRDRSKAWASRAFWSSSWAEILKSVLMMKQKCIETMNKSSSEYVLAVPPQIFIIEGSVVLWG